MKILIRHGITISPTNILPIDATTAACDVETREEITIATGEQIHACKIGSRIMVSKSLCGVLEKRLSEMEDWESIEINSYGIVC